MRRSCVSTRYWFVEGAALTLAYFCPALHEGSNQTLSTRPQFAQRSQRTILTHAQRITTHWPKFFIFWCAGRAWWYMYVWLGLYWTSLKLCWLIFWLNFYLTTIIWQKVGRPSKTMAQQYYSIESTSGISRKAFVPNNYPSKHETLNQCWVNLRPQSTTLTQQLPLTPRVCWDQRRGPWGSG